MALGRKPIEIVNHGKHPLLTKAPHWDRIFLREIAEVQNGFAFSSKFFSKTGGIPLVRIRDIDQTDTVDKYTGAFDKEFVINNGDILVGMDGDFKVAIWKGEKALLNQRVCRIIPTSKKFDKKFLFICIQPFLDAIHAETSSVTVKHLSSRTIEEIPLPYPPLHEQLAIVSKIEELFSELDKGIDTLHLAQQQLATYRQAVLKCAFEGRLTSANIDDNKLPEGWSFRKLEFIISDGKRSIRTGPFGTQLKKEEHQSSGVPVLGIENIGQGKFLMPNKIFITPEKAKTLVSFSVRENDVIISRSGTVGEICLVPPQMANSIISTNLIKVSLDQKVINPKYFVFLFQGGSVRQEVFNLCKGSSRAFLNQTILKSLRFPYCDLTEQNNVVEAIESRFGICEKFERDIDFCLQQTESLRQSILKKAFEGQLLREESRYKKTISEIKLPKLKYA
jgi:type I restriction enzyme S subunit